MDQAIQSDHVSALAARDRFISSIMAILLSILGFFAADTYRRLGGVDLLLRESAALLRVQEQRFAEDHNILMTVEGFRQSRLLSLQMLEDRVNRLEQVLFYQQVAKP